MTDAAPSAAFTMKILNDIAGQYPDAISFAAGRPPDDGIECPNTEVAIRRLLDHDKNLNRRVIGQYSKTNGIILDTLSKYLRVSNVGDFDPEHLMVTNGAQEAILLALAVLVGKDKVAIAPDPTYVGITGPAEIFGYALETFKDDADFVDEVERRAQRMPPVGLVYVVPDFANPSGRVMPADERRRLVQVAERYGFHILEDCVYRLYRYEANPEPTIKSFDRTGKVIYVESFAKTVLPSLRTAVVTVDDRAATSNTLADRMVAAKSYASVATSPIAQTVLAGLLIDIDCQIDRLVAPRRAQLKANRDLLLQSLAQVLGETVGFRWHKPVGGFFLTLEVPRAFASLDDLLDCAKRAGVIAMPMNLFSPSGRHGNQIRLAFSNVTHTDIRDGVARLFQYFRS